MATIKQIAANRQNAKKSTGPKTPEGKAAVAQNAIKHGLYTWTLLLPEEDQAKYDTLADQYIDHYQPEGLEEIELVEQLVSAKWELCRFNLMKRGVFDSARRLLKHKHPDPSAVQICAEAGADPDFGKWMARISQMEGRVHRRCDRARRELQRLQDQRANQPQPEAQAEPVPQPEVQAATEPAATIPVAEPAAPQAPQPVNGTPAPDSRPQTPDPTTTT